MRFLAIGILTMLLTACAITPADNAVRDATKEPRRQHARALIGDDIEAIRGTGEIVLTALACGWDEESCPQ